MPWLEVPVHFLSQEVVINVDLLKIQVMGSKVDFFISAETADKQLLSVLPYPRNKLQKVPFLQEVCRVT